jgi:hypothetical protein
MYLSETTVQGMFSKARVERVERWALELIVVRHGHNRSFGASTDCAYDKPASFTCMSVTCKPTSMRHRQILPLSSSPISTSLKFFLYTVRIVLWMPMLNTAF